MTQAAVSARIAQLEGRLGTRLFTRQCNNIQLTSSGHRLLPYAETIASAWNRAVLDSGAGGDQPVIAIGCIPSIAEVFLDQLLAGLRALADAPRIHVEQANSLALVPRVRDQSLSLALLYEPPRVNDLVTDHIADIELVLVSSTPGLSTTDDLPQYVYVDWGTSVAISHDSDLAQPPAPVMHIDTPGPAHRLLTTRGGSAYLPRLLVESDLASGRLHTIADAAVIERPVFLIRSIAHASPIPSDVLDAIHGLTQDT